MKIKRVCISGNNIHIFWYDTKDTCDKFVSYDIYAQPDNLSPYVKVAIINNFNSIDFLHINAKNSSVKWKYFIGMRIFCGKDTIVYSDTAGIDLEIPQAVELDSVSVQNNELILGWLKSNSPDTKGYIIYYVDASGNNIILDTVYGKDNTFYKDLSSGSPSNNVTRYRIAAIDSCDNISKISSDHNNILIRLGQDSCLRRISMSWNFYQAWNNSDYDWYIYIRSSGGAYSIADTLQGSFNSFQFLKPVNGTIYYIFVRAKNRLTGYTTSSNIAMITTDFVEAPDYLYLRDVTVDDQVIQVYWNINKNADLKRFNVYRGNDTTNMFYLAKTDYNGLSYQFTDTNVNVNLQAYYYHVIPIDYCDNPLNTSNKSGSIYLELLTDINGHSLQWNRYVNWLGEVDEYAVYSKDIQASSWIKLDVVDKNTTEYSKGMSTIELKGKNLCYYVEATEGPSNPYGFRENSISNVVCIVGEPIVFIPTAFVPGGLNNFFLPKGDLIDWEKSNMTIYNRWGEIVYEKVGMEFGWNGLSKGEKEIPGGVYYYRITIVGLNGNRKDYNGTVTMIK